MIDTLPQEGMHMLYSLPLCNVHAWSMVTRARISWCPCSTLLLYYVFAPLSL